MADKGMEVIYDDEEMNTALVHMFNMMVDRAADKVECDMLSGDTRFGMMVQLTVKKESE